MPARERCHPDVCLPGSEQTILLIRIDACRYPLNPFDVVDLKEQGFAIMLNVSALKNMISH